MSVPTNSGVANLVACAAMLVATSMLSLLGCEGAASSNSGVVVVDGAPKAKKLAGNPASKPVIAGKSMTVPSGGTSIDKANPGQVPSGSSSWGANYFPNVELINQDGESFRFFDDLIKDKVVMINFIYTSCPDSCPLETARLAQVADILGERVGDDVFIYSISIDPENDTPEVLKQYAGRYGAGPGWMFLTGKEDEIISLRRKLGLYLEDIQKEDSNNHNLSLIIGNQKTGRWMKRSPFENAHVLATQVGSWLHNWKAPSKTNNDFANAPKLRSISDGERLFRTRCASCHTIDGQRIGGTVATDVNKIVGPDLLAVTTRRDPQWLVRWIAEPDKMLEEKDPLAMELLAQFNNVPMPNMRLNSVDVKALIDFLALKSSGILKKQTKHELFQGLSITNTWIREAHPDSNVSAGYLTFENQGERKQSLVSVKSDHFKNVEFHEMTVRDGMKGMRAMETVDVAAGRQTELRPGGKHLMLIGPKQPLVAGDEIKFTFVFRSGARRELTFPVLSIDG